MNLFALPYAINSHSKSNIIACSLFTQACSTEHLPHKYTKILSSASCTLTLPCPCKAELCYNKIQGYTVALCCQTPSDFHLKDLVVFCSPADLIKLELQIEIQCPTAKSAHAVSVSGYTDWWDLWIIIKQIRGKQTELLCMCACSFHLSLNPCPFTVLF